MKVETFLGVLLVITFVCHCQTTSLIVDVVELLNSESYTFVCNTSPSTNLTRWTYLSGSTGTSLMSYQNEGCAASPSGSFLSYSNRFSYACNSTVYQVTFHADGSGDMNNRILSCKDAYQLTSIGSTWIIKTKTAIVNCSYCQPTISFDVIEIAEGDKATFVCNVPSSVSYVNWNRNIEERTAAMSGQNGQCTTQGTTFLDNTSKYIYKCSNTEYQVTILNVQRREHNDIYMCTATGQPEGTGSKWILKIVKAQVISVTIITPPDSLVTVKEKTIVNFTCTTSTARPSATVYLYRHANGQSSHKTQITSNVTTTTDYNDLSISTSILRLFVTRQDNDIKVFCTANNAVNRTELRSSTKRQLNVLYTSDDPYIVNGREYRVVENTQGTLSCTVRGGNPTPTLSWSCTKFSPANQSTTKSNENVSTTLTWNVSRNHDGTCTCTSTQAEFTGKSEDVRLVVLYEATIKSFKIERKDVTNVTVDENDTVDFICTADSNPEAVITLGHERKTLKTVTSNIAEYNIDKARCSDAGIYHCSAINEYIGENVSTQTIILFVNCIPDTPTELIQIQSHTTTSSVHIEWRPGYNDGPNQTFYIKYKKNSDTAWTYFTVIDSGEEIMDISLTGLAEDTQYDIVIFASNTIGNSSETPVLVASTKATHTNLGPLIGGIAGAVTACLIIAVIIIVIFRRFTLFKECWEKRSHGKSDGTNDTAEEHAYYNTGRLENIINKNNDATAYDEIGSVTDRDNNLAEDATSNNVARVPNYEMVNLNNVDTPQYSSLDQTEQCTTDDTSSVDNRAVYENMKIKVF